MSLILEALKKSEARRQLGEAPGLGTPFTVTRQRRSALPLILVLIVVAAGLGWWYVRTMPPAPAPAAGRTISALPPAAPAPAPTGLNRANASAARSNPAAAAAASNPSEISPINPVAAARSAMTAQRQADARSVNRPSLPMAQGSAPPPPASETAGPQAPANSERAALRAQRRNVAPARSAPERRARFSALMEDGKPSGESQRAPRRPSPPASTMHAVAPAPGAAPAVANPQTATPAPANPQAATNAQTAAPAPANPQAAASAAANPATSNLPMYYELPFEARKQVLPLTLSMHVYAADPAQRFVVIDGARKSEGETVKDDVTLREIVPDGVVLEYRGQRFFYPRPGH